MLTDLSCKRAECAPEKKRVRLSDEGGLYLEVAPNGSKRWFWKPVSCCSSSSVRERSDFVIMGR